MNPAILTFIFVFAISMIISTIAVVFLIKNLKKKMVEQTQNAAAVLGGISHNGMITGETKGFKYKCKKIKGSKNSPPSWEIKIYSCSSLKMNFSREGAIHTISKKIGLTSELQTNDKEFDELIFVDSRFVKPVQMYLCDSDVRRRLIQMFRSCDTLSEISFDSNEVVLLLSPCPPAEKIGDLTKELLANICELIKKIPVSANVPGLKENSSLLPEISIITLFAIYIISGITMLAIGVSKYNPLFGTIYLYGIFNGLISLMVLLFIAYQFIRGKSYSHKIFLGLTIAGMFGAMFFGMGSLVFTNGYFDSSQPVKHNTKITDKYSSRSKNSTSYFIKYIYWDEKKTEESISVSYDDYEASKKNDEIIFTTSEGRWGYEWLVNMEFTKRANPVR